MQDELIKLRHKFEEEINTRLHLEKKIMGLKNQLQIKSQQYSSLEKKHFAEVKEHEELKKVQRQVQEDNRILTEYKAQTQ